MLHTCRLTSTVRMGHAGLRGMAARDSIAAGEVLASVPVANALVVSPRERCSLPRDFCDAAFYSRQPWCGAYLTLFCLTACHGNRGDPN